MLSILKEREIRPWKYQKKIYKSLEQSFNSGNYQDTYYELNSNVVTSTIAIDISYDGEYVASSHGDHTIKVFQYTTGEQIRNFYGHPRTPWTVKFNPKDSNIVASGCLGYEARIWNIQLDICLNMIRYDFSIITMSFHPSAELLAVASGQMLQLWNWRKVNRLSSAILSPTALQDLKSQNKKYKSHNYFCRSIENERSIRAVIFHPSGNYLFVAAPYLKRDESKRYVLSSSGLTPCRLYCINYRDMFDDYPKRVLNLQAQPIVLNDIHVYSDGGIDVSKDGKYVVVCGMLLVPRHHESSIPIDLLRGKLKRSFNSSFSRFRDESRIDGGSDDSTPNSSSLELTTSDPIDYSNTNQQSTMQAYPITTNENDFYSFPSLCPLPPQFISSSSFSSTVKFGTLSSGSSFYASESNTLPPSVPPPTSNTNTTTTNESIESSSIQSSAFMSARRSLNLENSKGNTTTNRNPNTKNSSSIQRSSLMPSLVRAAAVAGDQIVNLGQTISSFQQLLHLRQNSGSSSLASVSASSLSATESSPSPSSSLSSAAASVFYDQSNHPSVLYLPSSSNVLPGSFRSHSSSRMSITPDEVESRDETFQPFPSTSRSPSIRQNAEFMLKEYICLFELRIEKHEEPVVLNPVKLTETMSQSPTDIRSPESNPFSLNMLHNSTSSNLRRSDSYDEDIPNEYVECNVISDQEVFVNLIQAKPLTSSLMKAIVSTKFSASSGYIVLGYGVRNSAKEVIDHPNKRVACEIIDTKTKTLDSVAVFTHPEDEVNVSLFHPLPGSGLVYGTKTGKLRVFRRSFHWDDSTSDKMIHHSKIMQEEDNSSHKE